LVIGGIFSVAGLLTLALMYFIGNAMLKSRPGQRASGHRARANPAKKAN
jgi:hypothetical protein